MARNKKIVVVTHYYPAHKGGVEIVAGQLAKYLASDNLSNDNLSEIVWIASAIDSPPENTTGLTCRKVSAFNIIEEQLHLPYPIWGLTGFSILISEIRKADLIHLHDYLYLGNITALILAKIYKKPVVITQHIGHIPYKNILVRGVLSFLNKTLGSRMLESADQIIFISKTVQEYFENFSSISKKSCFIPNGVDVQIFQKKSNFNRNKFLSSLNILTQDPVCLFVGRFVEKKGLDLLYQLAKRLNNIHWIFAGWGPLDPELWNLKNVSVFKNLPSDELALFYQAACLLVLPSRGEGFPLVVQEAMACGMPVMVSPDVAQAYPEATPLMFTADVESSDAIAEWSEKIEAVLNNPELRFKLKPQIAAFAAEHWSWEKCAQQYQNVFESCIKKSHKSAQNNIDLGKKY